MKNDFCPAARWGFLYAMKSVERINLSLPFCMAWSGSTMCCYLNVANIHLPHPLQLQFGARLIYTRENTSSCSNFQ